MKRFYSIFADYNQFYLWDKRISPDAPDDYADSDIERKIKAAPNVVVIQPERNMEVPVELEITNAEPYLNLEGWDHVAEASLELPSGHLEVHECTGGPIDEIVLAPGIYRVHAYFGGLGELSEDRLEGNDHYRLVIWPAPFAPITVLKQYRGGNEG